MARRLKGKLWPVAALAVVLIGVSFSLEDPLARLAALCVAGGMLALCTLIFLVLAFDGRRQSRLMATVSEVVIHDAAPTFVTDHEGALCYRNRSADDRFDLNDAQTLSQCFSKLFANPSAILQRLQNKALTLGAAREDIVTRRGHVRLAAHTMGADALIWRLEDIAERPSGGRGADGLSLPMLTASKSGAILFMNEAFRRLVGARVKSLDRIFKEMPLKNGGQNTVETAEGPTTCIVAEVEASGGRREIYLVPGVAAAVDMEPASWQFFDELPVPLMKFSRSGEVLLANRPARDLIQRPIEAGTPASEFFESLGRSVTDWIADAALGRGLHAPEFLRVAGLDEDTFVQVTLNRVQDEDDISLVAVLTDATELKSLEAQFVQSQKMQAIGQLAGGVAHDFNNLLTAISGHCDLLLLRHDQGDQDYGDLMQIHQNANRAASLVGQLLAFSRKQTLQPEVLDMRDTLADLAHLLNRLVGEKVTLTLNHDPGLAPIRADKRQLEQVLMNLVVNARDAMPGGGKVVVETAMAVLSEPLRRDRAVVPPGDYVVIKVQDNGSGIPTDKLSKIFEPFFTTKPTGEGTGLGLSTAYGIVKQTGGFIFAESAVGAGSTFTLFLPAHAQLLADAPAVAADTPVLMPEKTEGVVLLVEDEAPVRAFASRALRLRGFTVLEADCAETALTTLEDKSLQVDIFVTDVIMPGKDGPSWVREAMVDRPEVKVVFVSGYAEDAFEDKKTAIPNSVFLPKPFSLTDLTTTVQNALH